MPAKRSALAIVAGLTLISAAAPADASTITGRVAGGKPPKAGRGFTTVRAVDARSLRLVDVAKVRSRRYRLNVPAGSYWMFVATTPLRGKAGVDRSAGKVGIRKGKRKAVPVSLRKPKGKRRRPSLPTARAAFIKVKYPAVWVQHFSVSGGSPDLAALRKGIADMLITDLGPPLEAACGGVLVEREKLAFLLTEQVRTDPTRPPSTAKMIGHNRTVTGGLVVAGATTTLTVTVTNVATGTARSVTRSAATDRFFELETSVLQEVVRLICGDKPPGHYSGQASGSMSASSGGDSQTLSWNGNVRQRFTGDVLPAAGGDPPGEYAVYETESGSMHVILDGVSGECTYHGVADVAIVPVPGEHSRVQQGVDEPNYTLLATLPAGAALNATITGPEHCGGGDSFVFPLGGRAIMATRAEGGQRSSSTTLVGTATSVIGPLTLNWRWSLAPEAS